MSTTPFHAFIELVQFDQDVQKRLKNIQHKQEELDQQEEQEELLKHELEGMRHTVHNAQKIVHENELEMKKLDTREADIKTKLDEIANVKEYTALKKELDQVQAEQLEHEEILVTAWNHLETTQRSLAQKEGAIQEKITDIQAAIRKTQEELHAIKQTLQADTQARPEKTKQVNPEWLEKYEMMQGRVSNPVVEVVGGSCGGCFYAIPGQDLMRLKNRALLQCNSCYRFLYDPSVLNIATPAAQG